MEAILFKVLGFGVTGKTLLKFGLSAVVAVALWLSYSAVESHFDHISDLEKENKQLKLDLDEAETQRDQVIEINKNNVEAFKADAEIRAKNQGIALAEREALTARTNTYKEIRNAINSSPATDRPVAPVVLHTLDLLWGPDSTAGSKDRNPR